jgi:ABC-type lipoprotein release transport system permease subunit
MAYLELMLRTGLRHRWRSWLLLALLAATVIGTVLAGAQTARRTATAFPRYEAAHGYDAFFYSVEQSSKLRSLPEAASTTVVPSAVSGSPTCACRPIDVNDFSIQEVPPDRLDHMVNLVSGRMPDQADPYEVLASDDLAALGVHVGSVLHLPLVAASQRQAVLNNTNFTPEGPRVTVHVVGLAIAEIEFPTTSLQPAYDLYATQSFARRFNPATVNIYEYFVTFHHGAPALPQFESLARSLGGLSPVDLDAEASSISTSIDPQAVGWWILTGLAALVGLIVLAQALSRQAALEAGDYPTLSALGATRRQLFELTMIRTLLVAVTGAAGGLAVAAALSVLAPFGEARLADPSPGFDFDALLLLVGAVLSIVAVLMLGLWPAAKASRLLSGNDGGRIVRPSRAVTLLSASGAPPSALIGVRNALERGRGRSAVPVSSAIVGAILAVAVLCGTAVFGASLTHLTSTPSLYGQGFDAWFGTNGSGAVSQGDQLLAGIERPGIASIMAGIGSSVTINGKSVDAMAGQSVRGPLVLDVTEGRLPRADDEVVLGTKTMRELGARIGSTVRVATALTGGRAEVRPFHVVGTAVLPPDFNGQGLGTGAVFTMSALTGDGCRGTAGESCLVSTLVARNGVFIVRAEPDASGQAALAAISRTYSSSLNVPRPPTDLVNFGEAVNFPLIFGLIVVLFGVGTLLHLLLSSLGRRRQEMGLLKSLGMVKRQIALSVSWQTTTVAIIGIAIGVPVGIATGRLVWDAFATNLGVGAVPVVTAWVIGAVALGTMVAANLLAVLPAYQAARARPATMLRED